MDRLLQAWLGLTLLQAWLRLALGDTGVCTTIVAAQAMARAVCVPDPRGPAV